MLTPRPQNGKSGLAIRLRAKHRPIREHHSPLTELYIHAGKPTEELKGITGSWRTRAAEFEVFTNDPDIRQLIEEQKIIRIGYHPLRELQRNSGKE